MKFSNEHLYMILFCFRFFVSFFPKKIVSLVVTVLRELEQCIFFLRLLIFNGTMSSSLHKEPFLLDNAEEIAFSFFSFFVETLLLSTDPSLTLPEIFSLISSFAENDS